MAGETSTPNVGFQIPGFNQSNWQVPINFDLNLLDQIFGGEITVPALSVANFIIANIGLQMANSFVKEAPSGVIPGNAYTLTDTPSLLLGFYWNGLFQRPGIDYTVKANVITLTSGATAAGDTVYALYMK